MGVLQHRPQMGQPLLRMLLTQHGAGMAQVGGIAFETAPDRRMQTLAGLPQPQAQRSLPGRARKALLSRSQREL